MKESLAKLITNIFNPFLVSIVVLVAIVLNATGSAAEATKWILITIAISILPVFIAVLVLLRLKKLDGLFSNPREQRTGIYIFSSVLGIVSCAGLWLFHAPEILSVAFNTGLIAVIIFTGVNLFWKISLHTAFIAGSVTVLIIVFGAVLSWSVVLLPMVGWARVVLKQHTVAQVTAGACLASAIVCAVFFGSGIA